MNTLFTHKVVIFLIVVPCFAIGQGLPDGIAKIICKDCDSLSVFTTIIRSNKMDGYFPIKVFDKFYNLQEHHILVDRPQQKNAFIQFISKFYNQSGHHDVILQLIKYWCRENHFLNNITANPEAPPEAILFYNTQTKFLLEKYLGKNMSRQDWSSLTTYQLYELNIDYLNYTDNLSQIEKNDLHRTLLLTAKKHAND